MPVEPWNESGRVWEEDHGLLDAEQVAKCQRADVAGPLHSPVPTRMISNGEYMPVPQTDAQKRVEARVEELADEASHRLGISRRQFLCGSGGMAAALLAMNDVYGRFFDVSPDELYEPAAHAQAAPPNDLFVFAPWAWASWAFRIACTCCACRMVRKRQWSLRIARWR